MHWVLRLLRFLWPKLAILPRPDMPGSHPYVRTYVLMRLIVGVLGVAVPLVIVFGEPILFDGQPFPRGSLSAYYYSGVREVFVGSLCAIGVFLAIYKIGEPTREARFSTFAGVAVILVALFPTGRPGDGVPLTPFQDLLGENVVQGIHFASAGVFIGLLAVLSHYFAIPPPKGAVTGRNEPLLRRFHLACVGLIVAAVALALVAGITSWPDKGLLIAEVVAVVSFGASWFVKGADRMLFAKPAEAAEQAPQAAPIPPPAAP